jgi:hypothetical protein
MAAASRQPMEEDVMKQSFCLKMVFALVLVMLLAFSSVTPTAIGADPRYRWDTISLSAPNGVLTINPGGSDYALADDLTTLQISGHGTFGGGVPPTGGGSWATTGASGTASGTFHVSSLIQFRLAPGSLPPGTVDNIGGNPDNARSGLAILRVDYSDGTHGILVVSCHLPVGSPSGIFEGITATKAYVDYWNRVAPVPGVDANRTNFHILP